jgi:hypothetical protein
MLLPTLLLTTAALAAPSISTDRQCYAAGHDTIAIEGTGFVPNAPVTLTFTGNDQELASDATAGADGTLKTEVGAPSLADFDNDTRGIPVAITTADGAMAGIELSDWSATVDGFGRALRRGRSVELDTYGWIGRNTIYAHYMRGGKVVASQRIGTTTGACGELTKRFKAFSFRGAKRGSYQVAISADATFDKRNRWIGFKHVRLAS